MDQPVNGPVTTRARSTSGNAGGPSVGARREAPFTVAAPTLELPKGGGAVRGIGEKFAANPVTGTGSLTVPIATSRGRGGFGPQLALSYDSGAGNGPFGFGWSLQLPHVTRRTDKGLPRYDDAGESDVFLMSGDEDLVPVLAADASRFEDRATEPGHVIHRYRPRIEGLFARIERWTRLADGDVHWRSMSSDNVLTIYGKKPQSRVADSLDAMRVFTWLICETRDDKGNVVLYDYKPEDGEGVNLAASHERNRGPRDDPRRTNNRYLKRIRYGNRAPLLDSSGRRPRFLTDEQIATAHWMFEVVFDYGEHDVAAPRPPEDATWMYRADAFSTRRAGFEVRTGRRCRRVLMFHHFERETEVGSDCLVRSTDLTYRDELSPPDVRYPMHSFMHSVTQCGYRHHGDGYLKRSLPPVEFEYSVPVVDGTVQDVDPASLENLPSGLDGTRYQWTDLHGEGIPGLLTEQGGAWYYKRNLSPVSERGVEFAAIERVATRPNVGLAGGQAQVMDLAGNGLPDLVVLEGPTPGLHQHDGEEGWEPFRPFTSRLNRDVRDPNVRFVDLDGDGRADVLITEDDALVWHASLAEEGFGPARRVAQALDEETGPRLVFADATQSLYVADMTGDGLPDIARIRNGEVSYWPNLGYGRFGPKVTMDRSPHFDRPDRFDQRRIRLADIDGSGASDVIYLSGDGVVLYFNESGNGWSAGQGVAAFPGVDNIAAVQVADLKGNGTACLVWSSPLPGHATQPMRYIELMGGQKPHLLVRALNNLGAETVVHYAPSTTFYLADKLAGAPWVTKLPFPVHVVERVEIADRVSGNRFVTRYAYHHGYFDGEEREFRGFGMVEQFDTEAYAALAASGTLPTATNVDESSHVPPVLTRSWFHTGVYLDRQRVSTFFAGSAGDPDSGEYYYEPGALLLEDTVLPSGLTEDEEREACRALKGAMLRQEVYALDGSEREACPYTVTEQNFTLRVLQPKAAKHHAVFLRHPREAITYHYERTDTDPRIAHAFTLDADDFGNVLTSAGVGYGRRLPDPTLSSADQERQAERLVTCSESAFTIPVDSPDAYRTPLPSESRTYELAGLEPDETATYLGFDQMRNAVATAAPLEYEAPFTPNQVEKRLIEHVRTLYRPDDLGATQGDVLALLALGELESLALPGESYKLAFTPRLITQRFGDKVTEDMLAIEGRYTHSQGDGNWWLPSGRVFLSPETSDNPVAELAHARAHFFQVHRVRDAFHRAGFDTERRLAYDAYDLSIRETRDALANVATALHDYRVLQPRLMTDPNGNRVEVAFDALGMVVGTAVMGKTSETKGDSLVGFTADLDEATIGAHLDDPLTDPHALLQRATTRIVYDLFAYQRSRDQAQPQPSAVYALARETHDTDVPAGEQTRIQHGFWYSDGFGREIQKKAQAEPGPLAPGGPAISPRWVGSGWSIFNNKGKPVRQYEPFFSATHRFEVGRTQGVSPVLFYDPAGRVVGILHPNHTWEKVAFDAWREERWDVIDTVLSGNPRTDAHVADYFRRLSEADYLPTWHEARAGGAMGAAEQSAATKAAFHDHTPAIAHLDSLGRTFLTVAHNRFTRSDALPDEPPEEVLQSTRIVFDIEGNQREVIDALGRIVMRYDHDMLGGPVHAASMDAGQRWTLNDVAGKPLYAWDSRDHRVRTHHDVLGRLTEVYVASGDTSEGMVGKTVYGESQTNAAAANLLGKTYQLFDGAGVVTTTAYDFKGNALASDRQLTVDYRTRPDWSTAVPLEAQAFVTRTTVDALNRLVVRTTPDGSTIRAAYNEASLLEAVDVNLHGEMVGGELVWTPFVTGIDYDAKGQRERVVRGNGAATTYTYDPLTLRLVRLLTLRDGSRLQHLSYTYDPVGNITHVEDDAQQTIYFRNRRVEPSNDYAYDATYQLIEATGREHVGQQNGEPTAPDAFDRFRTGLEHPGDGNAMGLYLERYVYDAVGNILQMQHVPGDPSRSGWTRAYTYTEASQIELDRVGNRLASTQVGAGPPEPYTHDAHGSMTSMPHLPVMRWNYADQLEATSQQVVESGTPEATHYVYDGAGQRVRKVTDRAAALGVTPTRMKERLYLGGSEVYREYDVAGRAVALERETLHITDGQHRIALVETRTQGDDGSPARLIRYQLGNHVGSASVELDAAGGIVSYEETYPYGGTWYQAVESTIKAATKRYRYTGTERDEESGLSYHSARYCAPWLGRWVSADPDGVSGGLNLFAYGRNNPVSFVDPNGRSPGAAAAKVVENSAKAVLAVIATDAATPEPTDAVPLKWGGEIVIGGIALLVLGATSVYEQGIAPLPSAVQYERLDQGGGGGDESARREPDRPKEVYVGNERYPRWANAEDRALIDSGAATWNPESGWSGPMRGTAPPPAGKFSFAAADPRIISSESTHYTSSALGVTYDIKVTLVGTGNMYGDRQSVGYVVELTEAQFRSEDRPAVEEHYEVLNEQVGVYKEHGALPVALPPDIKGGLHASRLGARPIAGMEIDEGLGHLWDGMTEAENQLQIPSHINGVLGRADTTAHGLAVAESGYGTPLEYVRLVWR